MNSSFRHILIALQSVILLLTSCENPHLREQYVLKGEEYVFEVDMSDSLATYDVSIYTRVDSDTRGFPVEAIWTSPSGHKYSERIYFNLLLGQKQPYRSALVPVEWGCWTLELSVPEVKGMRGMGIITQRND